MDIKSKEERSRNMSCIKSKNTTPEKIVRSFLHKNGFRFRLCVKDLPGKPDIVLPKYKTVIEVRGCFWHRHDCKKGQSFPSSNIEFWQKKFQNNIKNDLANEIKLEEQGWRLIVIWECEVKSPDFLNVLPEQIRNNVLC